MCSARPGPISKCVLGMVGNCVVVDMRRARHGRYGKLFCDVQIEVQLTDWA